MIDIKNITKSFGSLQVLKGIDLHIDKGEVVSIVGPSGAGKTTLLQIIGTLDRPDSGQVIVDGIEAAARVYRYREYHDSRLYRRYLAQKGQAACARAVAVHGPVRSRHP